MNAETRQVRRRAERVKERRRQRNERREQRELATERVRKSFGHVQILAVAGDGLGPAINVGVKRGLLGHPLPHPMITVTEDELVAALDDTKQLAPALTKLGILVLAQLTKFPLALGPDALVEHAARWAGVDVDGLREAAIAERHEACSATVGHDEGTVWEIKWSGDPPAEPGCPCTAGQYNDECASRGCGFCAAERDLKLKEKIDAITAVVPAAGGVQDDPKSVGGSGPEPGDVPLA